MKVRFTQAQHDWLLQVTGTTHIQDAIDMFVDCLRQERIDAKDLMSYINKMMAKQLPPGKGGK